jgi:phage-related protein
VVDFRVEGTASLDPEHIIADVDEIIHKLDELKDKVEETDLKLDELARKHVDVEVLVNGEDKLTELRAIIDDLDARTHTLTVAVDIRGLEELTAAQDFIDAMDAKDHTLAIDVDVRGQEELDILRGDLFTLEDHEYNIPVTVEARGFDEVMAKLLALDEELRRKKDDLGSLSKALDDTSSSADRNSGAASKLAFSWMLLAPALIPLLPLVSILAGGILGLASAFYTMSVPLVGLALSVKGFLGDFSTMEQGLNQQATAALGAANSYQDIYNVLQKNSTAFQQMDPLLKNAAVEYELLKHALDDFQTAVEPAVLPMLVDGFHLLEQVLQVLAPMVSIAANAVDNFLVDFSNRLKDPVFTKFFADVEANLGTFITDWLVGFTNILEGFTALMDGFMPLGLDMSNGFLRMTESFDKWAQAVTKTKGFKDFVAFVEKEGPVFLNVLGQIVVFIGHLFTAIGSDSGSASLLSTLDRILKSLNAFATAHPGMFKVAADLLLIGMAASKLLPMIGPLLSLLATPEGAVVAVVVALGAALFYAYEKSKEFHDFVNKTFGPMWDSMRKGITEAKKFFVGLWPDIVAAWRQNATKIKAIVGDLADWVKHTFSAALKIIEGIVDVFVGIFEGKWSKVADGLKKIWSGLWEFIWNTLKDFVKIIWNILSGLFNDINKLALESDQALERLFQRMMTNIGHAMRGGWETVTRDTVQWGKDLWNAVVSAWDSVTSWLGGIGGRITRAIGDLGSLLVNAGRQIIQGFINGLQSMVSDVSNFFSGLMNDILSWKGPPSKDRVHLYNAGASMMEGFINGLESKYSVVKSSLTGLTKNIEDTFGKQYTANIGARIGSAVQDATFAVNAYNRGGQLPSQQGGTQVSFAPGAIVINSPRVESAGVLLTRALQGAAHFGTVQPPVGYSIHG